MWRITSPLENAEPSHPEAWITLRVRFDHEEEARFVVLGFGPRVDVIEPVGLRNRIIKEATEMIERHRRTIAEA
jgi:predicted DNA-binding transcriptional regulator YafY